MSTIDYSALGKNEKVADRRFKVLRLTMKGLTPVEVLRSINALGGVYAGISYKTIQRDVCHLQTTQLNNLPLEIIKDMGNTFFELKIREYENELKTAKNDGARVKLHDLIHRAKIESLKIAGAYVERVELDAHLCERKSITIASDDETQALANELLLKLAAQNADE